MITQLNYCHDQKNLAGSYIKQLHLAYSRCADLNTFLDEFLSYITSEMDCLSGLVFIRDIGCPVNAGTEIRTVSLGFRESLARELNALLSSSKTILSDFDSIIPLYDSLKTIFSRQVEPGKSNCLQNRLLLFPILRFDTLGGAVLLETRQIEGIENRGNDLVQGMILEMYRLASRLLFSEWLASKGYNLRLIGISDVLLETERMAIRFAKSNCPVLVTGETGTGKELIAHSIHYYSARRNKPFVPVNCGAFTSESLLASELFGHVKGAFTDARKERKGKFELAEGGTLFLDEVACMSPTMQVALLRTLRYGEVQKVGDDSPSQRVNVRIVAACNEDLQQKVRNNSFREDMYSRLSVANIRAPSLRERANDIPLLVNYFLAKISQESDGRPRAITAAALDQLSRWKWPDNIAGLENALHRADLVSNGAIQIGDLPEEIRRSASDLSFVGPNNHAANHHQFLPLQSALREFERSYIVKVIDAHAGNVSATARTLDISRQGLQKKMCRYGIGSPQSNNSKNKG
jgi:DNA-binding NtrC family response regulator